MTNTTDMQEFYDKLDKFLIDNNVVISRYQSLRFILERKHPILYSDIFSKTSLLPSTIPILGRLYCLIMNVGNAKCLTCGNNVTWSRTYSRGFYRYCNKVCAMKDMKTLIGVENTSQLPSVKSKKRQNAIDRFGVTNVAKAPMVRAKIRKLANERWQKIDGSKREHLYDNSVPMTKRQYFSRVRVLTESTYSDNIDLLDPQRLRSYAYHLDHKISVYKGYIDGIAPEIMARVENLQLLPASVNLRKSWR